MIYFFDVVILSGGEYMFEGIPGLESSDQLDSKGLALEKAVTKERVQEAEAEVALLQKPPSPIPEAATSSLLGASLHGASPSIPGASPRGASPPWTGDGAGELTSVEALRSRAESRPLVIITEEKDPLDPEHEQADKQLLSAPVYLRPPFQPGDRSAAKTSTTTRLTLLNVLFLGFAFLNSSKITRMSLKL